MALINTAARVRRREREKLELPVANADSSLSSRPKYRPNAIPGANARNAVFKGNKIYEDDWDFSPTGTSGLLCSTSYSSVKK